MKEIDILIKKALAFHTSYYNQKFNWLSFNIDKKIDELLKSSANISEKHQRNSALNTLKH